MSSKPQGLHVGSGNPRKPHWKIGKRIGSGACASVHELSKPEGTPSGFVVKVVPLPEKRTKKKTTEKERNERLLGYEEQLYRNLLPDYQGYILPNLPNYIGPPVSGDADGYRYLVMEQMKGSLWDIIPALLRVDSPTIDVSPIAERLLHIVELIHEEKHLVVDIKPENFMLALNNHDRKEKEDKETKKKKKKASKSTPFAKDLSQKIRILDLGLLAPWKTSQGHRPDEGIGDVVGTPLYISRATHEKHTPSRRDDMEMLGYVVAELIIRLVAEANGESANYKGSSLEIPTYLPWSREKSDDAIGEKKAKEVGNIRSTFYKRMGDKETAKTMKSFFDLAGSMKYKEKPNYGELRDLFSTLEVTVEPPKKAPSRPSPGRPKPKTSLASTRATKRAAASRTAEDSDDNKKKPPTKQQKREEEEEFVDAMEEESVTDVIDVDEEEEDEGFEDAKEEDNEEAFEEAMEWEPVSSKENSAKPGSSYGVTITIDEGPHAGEHFNLEKGVTNAITIGKKPEATKAADKEALWPLPDDEAVDDVHARLELKGTRQCSAVEVKDLSARGTFVEAKAVDNEKGCRAFINNKVTVGTSVFRITKLTKGEEGANASPPKKVKASKSTSTKASKQSATATKKKPLAEKNRASPDAKTMPDVVLQIIEGPHKGECFALSRSGVQTINFGSANIESDESIEQDHARFQLDGNKRMAKVLVTDLSQSGTFINGKRITKKGKKKKEQMAFLGCRVKVGATVLEIKCGK